MQESNWKHFLHLPTFSVLTVLGILAGLACLISEWSPVGLVKYSVRYTRGPWHQPDLCKTLYSSFYIRFVSDEIQHKRTFCAKKQALGASQTSKFCTVTLQMPSIIDHLKENCTGKWTWNVKCSENQMGDVKKKKKFLLSRCKLEICKILPLCPLCGCNGS